MANLTETAVYDAGVYQIETTDPVSGGATGIANKPLINLANRTAFLKGKVDGILAGTEALTGYAKLASPTFTGNPLAPTPALGDSDASIATTAFVQKTLGGVLSKSVAGGVNVTLTAVEAGNGILVFTGALTASISVIVPTAPTRPWVVFNNTTGAFTLTVKTASGTGVLVPQGKREIVYCDGTNVASAFTDFVNVALEGVPTAPTAATGTNTTQLATTAFVNAEIANDAAPASHVGATGAAHGVATTSVNGFMSSADKTKLDAVASGAAAVGSTAGAALAAAAAAGTATTAARSDHVHPYPTAAQVGAAAASHTHAIANISDWPTAVSMTEVGYLDGVTSAIQTQLNAKAASSHTHSAYAPLASPAFTGAPTAPTPAQFDNDVSLATTAFVQRALGNFQGSYSQSTTATLTAENAGSICNAFNSITLTLPLGASVPAGATYKINNAGAGVVSVVANAGNSLYAIGNGTPRSFNLQSGDELTIAYVGGNTWYAWGSAQLGFSIGQFGSSLAANGYQKLPSGLIIQWGSGSTAADGSIAVTFPIAFPTACVGIHGTHSGSGLAAMIEVGSTRSTTGVTTKTFNDLGATSAGWPVHWLAIGF